MKSNRIWAVVALLAVLIVGGAIYVPALVGRVAYALEVGQNDADRSHLEELSKHDQLSTLFRAVAKTVKPAVVEVRVAKKVAMRRNSDDMDEFLRRFFGDEFRRAPRRPRQQREFFRRGLGSGVIVDAKNGYVLTNYHVVGQADSVEIVLADKRKFNAEWVRYDWQTDLAVVKIKPDRLIEAPLGDSDKMRVGDWVLAIGAPRNLPQTVTAGIISAKGRVTSHPKMFQNLIQTDASINRGNSGGPLVNMKGQVIGLSNSILTHSGGNEGIGFAVPSNMAKGVLAQLVDTGEVVRGFLGVRLRDVGDKFAKDLGLPATNGALVTQVIDDTPAEEAGLQPEDFIFAVDGKAVANGNELRNSVAAIKPGKTISLGIYRDGKRRMVKVTLASLPDDPEDSFGRPGKADTVKFGLEVTTLTPDLAVESGYDRSAKGVLITKVDPISDAYNEGLQAGMVITHVRGRHVTTAEQFTEALAQKSARNGVRLWLMIPGGRRLIVFIAPK